MGSLLRVPSKGERRRCHGYIGPQLPPLACTLSTEMMRLAEDCRWSQLTILLASNGALCSHENQTEGSAGGSLSHVWRETGGKSANSAPACPEQNPHRDRRLAASLCFSCSANLPSRFPISRQFTRQHAPFWVATALSGRCCLSVHPLPRLPCSPSCPFELLLSACGQRQIVFSSHW